MKRWLWLALLLLPCAMHAQVVGPGFINYVTSAPSGACSQGEQQRNVIGLGTVYTCQSNTWTQIGTGAGTVSSVSFTGGLISVATPTTTPAFTVAGTSGGIPYFSGAATWASSAQLASGALVLGGGAGTAPATSANFTTSGGQLNLGAAGTSGVLGLVGLTSGTATCTAPAIAGTSTNPVTCSNILALPNGASFAPAFGFSASSTDGIFTRGAGNVAISITNTDSFDFNATYLGLTSGKQIGWSSGASGSGPIDVSLSRDSAGILDVNTTAAGNKAGSMNMASLSTGTSPPTCTTGTGGVWCAGEGTSPTAASAVDQIYADSTAHSFRSQVNGGSPGFVLLAQPGSIRSTGLVAAVSTATLCAAAAGACNQAGQYNVQWNFYESGTACGTPGTGGVTFLLTWTDGNGTAHSATSIPMDDSASLVAVSGTFTFRTTLAAAWASGSFNIDTNGSIIQYATGYTACSVGTGTYALSATVTRLQ